MKTKLLTIVMLLTLSAVTAFGQALQTVATMTVSSDRTDDVIIIINGTLGKTVKINDITETLAGPNSSKTLTIPYSETITISSDDPSNIIKLNFPDNNLTSLDVSSLTSLESLLCHSNDLVSLDVSGCSSLTNLSCYDNALTELNVSGLTYLTNLFCPENELTSLDVSGLTSLTTLSCYGNKLTSLDVSGLTSLEYLFCYDNRLTALDVSDCSSLYELFCNDNKLTSLNVSGCSSLSKLHCYGNVLTSLDVSDCSVLDELSCYDNELASLNVSGLTSLTTLSCYDNELTELNVPGLTSLTTLYCNDNKLTSLNASGCASLATLYCWYNSLTSLDVSGCGAFDMFAYYQDVVIDVPFNYSQTDHFVFFNGDSYAVNSDGTFDVPLPVGVTGYGFSGTFSIVRAADSRSRYNITMLAEEGVTTDRAVGTHEVIEGYDFRFYTTIADEYADYDLTVLVNGREVAPTRYDNMYIIENIDEDKEVAFRLTKKVDHIPTANEHLTATTVSAGVGFITIEASGASVQITSISGQVVYNTNVTGTTTVNVPQGLYIVLIDGAATKVVVK